MTAQDSRQQAGPGRLSNGKVVSYALGDVANNLSFMMTSMFFMAYMTDIAGIAAGVAGAIYGVTKVWAGFTDLLAGNTVDKANTRWGRLRPWLVGVSPFLAIVLVMMFSTPAGLSPTLAIVWILIFDALFQLCYSFINIPYGSLSAAMTEDAVDRSRLAGARSIASAVTGVALAIVLSPQFKDTTADNIRMKFTITTIILAVIACVLYFICFKNAREVVPRSPGKSSLKTTMSMVRQNRPLLMLCFGALFLLGAMFTMMAVQMYFARDVLGNANNFIYLQLANTVGTILVASLVPMLTVKLGKRVGYAAMAAVAVLSYVIIGLTPHGSLGLVVAVVAWFIYGIGSGGTNALMFSMQADTVDYGEWKTGIRAEGGAYSILSFVRKCGQGLGGFLGGAIIGAFGYTSGAAEQSERAITGIHVAAGWFPAVLAVIAALIVFFLYPLKPEQHSQIVRELNTRRAGRATDGATPTSPEGLSAEQPVVTINEQYGAGGVELAQKVARKLGVPYVPFRFSSTELEQAEEVARQRAEQDSSTTRFLSSFALTGSMDSDRSVAAMAEADHEMVMDNTRQLVDVARTGGVVVGHDATAVLADTPGVLHVRIEAPEQTRVHRASQVYGIGEDVATDRLRREDRMRTEMSQRLMHWDPADRSRYDLVIDAGTTGLDEAVDQVVQAYRDKAASR